MAETYTAEIKVTKRVPETKETDRYGAVTAITPAGESRIGHITLVSSDLEDLRERVTKVMDEITD
jgi:hypothetical protein